jgi:hypothetical protein
MINGFGTWNIGRRNVHATLDHCDQCGAVNKLKSYDTRRFIMALYIPLIPLGQVRVINHCGRCDKFRAVKLAIWKSGLAEMRAKVLAASQQSLDSDAAVEQILHPLIAYQDMETFATLASSLRDRYADDAYFLMHLGNAYTYFNSLRGAEEAYNASMETGDSQECRERLAWLLLLQDRPGEARPMLEHILETRNAEKTSLLYHLAVSYQSIGKHQEAMNVVDRVFAAIPELRSDKDWLKLRIASQRNLSTGKPITKGSLSQVYKLPSRKTGRWALILAPFIVLILLSGFIFISVDAARNRTIYLVSGLAFPYEVQLDDSTIPLHPNGFRAVQLAEGPHRYRADALGIPEEAFELHTNFFLRPFQEREVFVLNPDKVAVLMDENMEYMQRVDESAKYSYTVATNDAFYHFHNIHFPFQAFPEEVMLERPRETRRRLSAIPVTSSYEVYDMLIGEIEDKPIEAHMLRRFHFMPEDPGYCEILLDRLGIERFKTEAHVELAQRPVLIEVHRAYQSVTEIQDPLRDLEDEYAQLLAKEPDNGDLIYLLARVTDDLDRADELFEKASSPPYDCEYAVAALAFDSLSRGEFDEAERRFNSISDASKDVASFDWIGAEIQIARADYAAILERISRSATGVPSTESDALADVYYRTLNGNPDSEIDKSVNDFCAYLKTMGADKDTVEFFRESAAEQRAYASGDLDRYYASVDADAYPQLRFERALYEGDLDAAAALLQDEYLADATNHLALYICAARAGQSALTGTHLTRGAELLATGVVEDRYYASVLAGDGPLDIDRALRLSAMPGIKRIVLAALAIRYPEQSAPLNALARKLNYSMSFPYYILVDALSEVDTASDANESEVTPTT